jgi:hypothetical protein
MANKPPVSVQVSSSTFQNLLDMQKDSLHELQNVRKLMELSNEVAQRANAVSASTAANKGGDQKIQIDILGQIKEHVRLSRKYYKSQEEFEADWRKEARDITEMSKNMKTFKTLGEKLQDKKEGIKGALSTDSLKTGLLKSLNFGGIFDKTLAKDEFVKQQKALGSNQTNKELGADFEAQNKALKASNKNEAEIEKVKKAAKTDDEDFIRQKNPEFAALLDKRRDYADTLSTYNRSFDAVAPKDDGAIRRINDRGMAAPEMASPADSSSNQVRPATAPTGTSPNQVRPATAPTGTSGFVAPTTRSANQASSITAPATSGSPAPAFAASAQRVITPIPTNRSVSQSAAEETQNEETKIEQLRAVEHQSDLLEQIAENTGGKPSDQKAKAATGGEGGNGIMAGIGAGLKTLGGGLKGFGEGAGKGIKGLLKGIAEGIGSFGKTNVLKGAASMLVLSSALLVTAKALQEFGEVEWESVAKGGVALLGLAGVAMLLGKAGTNMIIGAAAIAVLGGALLIAGKGFQTFAELSWENIGKGFVALLGLGAVAAVLGMALPFIIPGAVAIGALGLALVPFAAAMALAGPAMDEFASGMERLAQISGEDLLKIAAGIGAVGVAMAAFGAGQAVAGLGNLVGRFLTLGADSPVDQLIKIGNAGEGVMKAADGLSKLSDAMQGFGKVDAKGMEAVNEFPWLKATAFVAAGGAMETAGTKVYNASKGNADEAAITKAGGAGNTNVLNAPINTNNTNTQVQIRPPIRNQESSNQKYASVAYSK